MDGLQDLSFDSVKNALIAHSTTCKAIAAVCTCVYSSYFLFNWYKYRQMTLKIAARGKRARDGIERLRNHLESYKPRQTITELPFSELQVLLQSGELTAVEVLRAYQAKALEVNGEINAITDVIEDAENLARHLDSLDASKRGPLHGIPISLKESCGLKGKDCTAGFGALVDVPNAEDSALVQVLKAKGAVPFIRTNLPQGCISHCVFNPMYGLTANPHDHTRSPGGSTGGEGAIIGAGGSILGVGSDIGGSVRIPASFCGVCSIKPTCGRISNVGNIGHGTFDMQDTVMQTDEPMGRDVSSVVHFMQAVLGPDHSEVDPLTVPLAFNTEEYESKRPLKIGYLTYDGCIRVSPAVERAVMEAKSALEGLGHTLVEVEPYKVMYAMNGIFLPLLLADDAAMIKELIKYDKSDPRVVGLVKVHSKPYWFRKILAKIIDKLVYDPLMTEGIEREQLRNPTDVFRKIREVLIYKDEFIAKWKSEGLDALICPATPCAAPTHGLEEKFFGIATYSVAFNVANFPAGVVPATKVTAADVKRTLDPKFYKPETMSEKMIHSDCKGTEGLPVGVQVAALPFHDELVLRVMKELETALQYGQAA